MRNMCFRKGKTKAGEERAQEESVDALSPGSLSVGVRSATQSIMASMRSVGKDMVRSSSHTITIITNNITILSITLSSREYMTMISIARFTSPERLHAV